MRFKKCFYCRQDIPENMHFCLHCMKPQGLLKEIEVPKVIPSRVYKTAGVSIAITAVIALSAILAVSLPTLAKTPPSSTVSSQTVSILKYANTDNTFSENPKDNTQTSSEEKEVNKNTSSFLTKNPSSYASKISFTSSKKEEKTVDYNLLFSKRLYKFLLSADIPTDTEMIHGVIQLDKIISNIGGTHYEYVQSPLYLGGVYTIAENNCYTPSVSLRIFKGNPNYDRVKKTEIIMHNSTQSGYTGEDYPAYSKSLIFAGLLSSLYNQSFTAKELSRFFKSDNGVYISSELEDIPNGENFDENNTGVIVRKKELHGIVITEVKCDAYTQNGVYHLFAEKTNQ